MFIVIYNNGNFCLKDNEWSDDFLLPIKIKRGVSKVFYIEDSEEKSAARALVNSTCSLTDDGSYSLKNGALEVVATGREVNWPYDENDTFIGFAFKE